MTQQQEMDRMWQKLSEIHKDVGKLDGKLTGALARCDQCNPIVMGGNGRKPMDTRVSVLENGRRSRLLICTAMIGGAAVVVAAAITAVAAMLAK
jgi:hypothetical protein